MGIDLAEFSGLVRPVQTVECLGSQLDGERESCGVLPGRRTSAGRSTPSTGWWRSTWSVGSWSLRRSTSPLVAHAWCTGALSCSQPQDFAGHQNLPFMEDINPFCCHLVLNHMPFNDI